MRSSAVAARRSWFVAGGSWPGVIGLIVIALILLGPACSSFDSQEEEFQEALQEERIIKMIDERRYETVVRLLEPVVDENRNSPLLKAYLAQAHLGLAGVEPLRLASGILGAQGVADPALERLIPGCPADPVPSSSAIGTRCMMKRLFQNLPNPDHPNFARGRELLREAFPVPSSTAPGHNLLVGIVETISAISRLGGVLLRYQEISPEKATDEEILSLFADIGKAAEEARRGLERGRHSARRISTFITGLDDRAVFRRSGVSLEYVEQTGVPLLLKIADSKSPADTQTVFIRILVLQGLEAITEALASAPANGT